MTGQKKSGKTRDGKKPELAQTTRPKEATEASFLIDDAVAAVRKSMTSPQPPLEPKDILAVQQIAGNRTVQRLVAGQSGESADDDRAKRKIEQTASGQELYRLVDYEEVEGGRWTDPEAARGVLPFTEGGWNGEEIASRLTQLGEARSPFDDVRCVETAFLVTLALRGPGAVRDMISNYLRRYRVGLSQTTTPPRIQQWYRRSIRNLTPLLARIDNQTLTYQDMSTILREMYSVYGESHEGTRGRPHINMLRREGYTETLIGLREADQIQTATHASGLQRGEVLWCSVHHSREGTGGADHNIYIGRLPDRDQLYLYDSAPIRGSQMVLCNNDLDEIQHYFSNPVEEEGEAEGEEAEGPDFEMFAGRTFNLIARFSPPGESEGGGE
jgi:hypothetical protein